MKNLINNPAIRETLGKLNLDYSKGDRDLIKFKSKELYCYEIDDKNELYFSYKTLIVAKLDNKIYLTNVRCSSTTERHLKWVKLMLGTVKPVIVCPDLIQTTYNLLNPTSSYLPSGR